MSLFLGQNLTGTSRNWKHWVSALTLTTCTHCAKNHGRIFSLDDINYESGFRNKARILFSNDGLIFASYDYYTTFYEITK